MRLRGVKRQRRSHATARLQCLTVSDGNALHSSECPAGIHCRAGCAGKTQPNNEKERATPVSFVGPAENWQTLSLT